MEHNPDYALAAGAAIAEFLAVRYSLTWLVWFAALLLWLAIVDYTKHSTQFWNWKYKWVGRVLVAVVLVAVSWKIANRGEAKDAITGNFKAEYIDMSRRLDHSAFWVLYRSVFGDTASPVALLAFMEISNNTSHPVTISTYAMSIKTEACGWVVMTPIDTNGIRSMVWGFSGFGRAEILDILRSPYPSFNSLWSDAIPSYSTQPGILLFDTRLQCEIAEGSPIELRLELTDSSGNSYGVNAFATIRRADPAGIPSVGDTHQPCLEFTEYAADISALHRKNFADPNLIKPGDTIGSAYVYRVRQNRFTLGLGDGAYHFLGPLPPKPQ